MHSSKYEMYISVLPPSTLPSLSWCPSHVSALEYKLQTMSNRLLREEACKQIIPLRRFHDAAYEQPCS